MARDRADGSTTRAGILRQGRAAAFLERRDVQLAALAIIVGVAAVFRFYKLGAWSFWGDEMLTIVDVPDGFNESPLRRSLSLTLIQATISWLGTSEWSARLVPALTGAVSVPLLYFPVRKLLGPAVALLFSLFLAVSPWHVYWSQNARFYVLLLLFYSLALLYLYQGLADRRPTLLLVGVLFLALAARERLLALYLIPIFVATVAVDALLPADGGRRFAARTLLLLAAPLLVAAIFAVPYLRNLPAWIEGFGGSNNTALWIGMGTAYYLRLPVLVMAGVGAVSLYAEKRRLALYLSLGAIVPPLSLMLLAPFHYTANRYAFVSLSSWLLLAAVGACAVMQQAARNKSWPALVVLALLLLDPISENMFYFSFNKGNRDDWRAAFALVQEAGDTKDRVISNHQHLANYYMGRPTIQLGHIKIPEDVVALPGPVWFVEDMTMADDFPEETAWINSNARLVRVLDNHLYGRNFKMRVYYYEPDP